MRLHLTRQANGLYALTARPPLVAVVEGEARSDIYLAPGEPIGIRNLCAPGVKRLFGLPAHLRRLTTIEVDLTGRAIDDGDTETETETDPGQAQGEGQEGPEKSGAQGGGARRAADEGR